MNCSVGLAKNRHLAGQSKLETGTQSLQPWFHAVPDRGARGSLRRQRDCILAENFASALPLSLRTNRYPVKVEFTQQEGYRMSVSRRRSFSGPSSLCSDHLVVFACQARFGRSALNAMYHIE
jgi:hypothetical protein